MADFFQSQCHFSAFWAHILAAIIHCVLLIQVIAVGALVFIWMERKVAGRIQDRLGPSK